MEYYSATKQDGQISKTLKARCKGPHITVSAIFWRGGGIACKDTEGNFWGNENFLCLVNYISIKNFLYILIGVIVSKV